MLFIIIRASLLKISEVKLISISRNIAAKAIKSHPHDVCAEHVTQQHFGNIKNGSERAGN